MADRIAVMKDGHLQAFAPPNELYDQPATLFIAGFIGNPPMNFLDVEVSRTGERYVARAKGFELEIPPDRARPAAGRGKVILGIRPEDIALGAEGIPGEVYVIEPLGRDDLVDIVVGDEHVRVLADPALDLKLGDVVHLQPNAHKVQFFDPETEKSLLWT